ncbi:MAG: M10 family metallopeptidase [Burkholderiales bacterium]|nr:M10 family metallopeptidase [Burkholderiales bacterium]
MATPSTNVASSSSGNAAIDNRINGLLQGSIWTFAGDSRTLTYSLNLSGFQAGSWTSERRADVAAALARWSDVANVTFQFVDNGGSSHYASSTADLAIILDGEDLSTRLGGASAVGVFPDPASAESIRIIVDHGSVSAYPNPEGDIFLEDAYVPFSQPYWEPGGLAFSYLIHEVGHSLGLKHPHDPGGNNRPTFLALGLSEYDNVRYTIMSYEGDGALSAGNPETPMPLDILAIQYLYGANMSTGAGDDVYHIVNDGRIRTIWDAGGNDTLDFSGWISNQGGSSSDSPRFGLDARAGAVTQFGEGGTIGIAYNVTIENLIGTRYSEFLFGDDAGQTITPGGGNDIVSLGSGRDRLIYRTGDGLDSVTDAGGPIDIDFGPGIGQNDLRIIRGGNNLLLQVGGVDAIFLEGNGAAPPVGEWTFSGGGSWQQADVDARALINRRPVVTAAWNVINPAANAFGAALLGLTASDADGDPIKLYEFVDLADGGATMIESGGGSASRTIVVRPDQVSSVSFFSGGGDTRDRFQVRVFDGVEWSEPDEFTVRSGGNVAPVAAYSGITQVQGTYIPAKNLLTVTDADGDGVRRYRFWDSGAGMGFFSLGGSEIAPRTVVEVDAADIGNLVYTNNHFSARGFPLAQEVLQAQVFDGAGWSAWVSWNQIFQLPENRAPTVSLPRRNLTSGQWFKASDLEMVRSDADGDATTQYQFSDGTTTTGSAILWRGAYLQQGATVTVDAADLGSLWMQGGSNNGTDVFRVRISDGLAWSEWADFEVVTRAPNRASVLTATGQSVFRSGRIVVSSLINVTDADGDSPVRYRFLDTVGGGYFSLPIGSPDNFNNYAQGQAFEVTAAEFADLHYFGGDREGVETLSAQVYDGTVWSAWTSWSQRTTRLSNALPTVYAEAGYLLSAGQWLRGSAVNIVYYDFDGDAAAQYEFRDDGAAATSARLWFGGADLPQAGSLTVSAGDLDKVWIRGATENGTETISVRANDGIGWSEWSRFSLISRLPNRAPVVVGAGVSVSTNETVRSDSLIRYSDQDGDIITAYRFSDPVGGGYFTLNGQLQAPGQTIEVSANNLSLLLYTGANRPGGELLWAQVYDGQAWSAGTSWNQQTVRSSNVLPTVSVPNRNIASGQWIKASDLGIVVTDGDGDSPTQYQITDGNANAGSTQLWHRGSYLVQGGTLTVNAGELGNVWVKGGANNGTDTFSVRAHDGYGWSDTAGFNLVVRAPNRAPVVTSTGTGVGVGATVAASTLINVSDADGDPVTAYRFWDTAGGGYFSVNGVRQAEGVQVSINGSLAQLSYTGGATAGGNPVWFSVYDGQAWSAEINWAQQSVRSSNVLPTVSVPNRNIASGQWIKASDFGIVVTDGDGDSPTQYQLTDGNANTGSTQLWYGGSYLVQGGTLTVNAGELGNVWVQGGANNGTDTFSVRAHDGYGWSNTAGFNLVTRAPNRAPVVASNNILLRLYSSLDPTTLFTVTDADGDRPTIYRFWDPTTGAGGFTRDGNWQQTRVNIDVPAAEIGSVSFVGNGSPGVPDSFQVQVFDGSAWSNWATIDTTSFLPLADQDVFGTSAGDVLVGDSFTTYFGAAGNDQLYIDFPASGAVLVGGAGADTYTVTARSGPGVNFIYDADSGGGDTLYFPGFAIPSIYSAIGVIDGTTLILGDLATNRLVVLPYWLDSARGGIDSFSNGSQTWDRAGVQGLLSQYADYIEYLSWEDLGYKSSEVRQFFSDVSASSANIDAAMRDSALRDLYRSGATAPLAYATKVLGRGDDSLSGGTWRDQTVHVGRQGNDTFGSSLGNNYKVVALGGVGDDEYVGDGQGHRVVLEHGASSGDRMRLFVDDLRGQATIVDGRHLMVRNFSASGIARYGTTLILDWRAAENRIETWTVSTNYVGQTPTSITDYSFDQFAALIDGLTLPSVTWERIDGVTTQWNNFITQAQAAEAAATSNRVPTIAGTGAAIGFATRTPLSSLFSVSDDDGQTMSTYVVGNLSAGGRLWSNGASVAVPGGGLEISASGLASYQVSSDGLASSVTLSIRAFDGYDWSSEITLTAAAPINVVPIVIGTSASIGFLRGTPLSSLFSVRDPDGQPIVTYRLTDLSAGGRLRYNEGPSPNLNEGTWITAEQLPFYSLASDGNAASVSFAMDAFDGYGWSGATPFTVMAAVNAVPTITGTGIGVGYATRTPLSSLFSVSDPEGQAMTTYRVTNLTGGARLWRDDYGFPVANSGEFVITAVELNSYRVYSDGSTGSISLSISAFDGFGWSAAVTLTAASPINMVPTVAGTGAAVGYATRSPLSSLFTVSDPEGHVTTAYRVGGLSGDARLWRAGIPVHVPSEGIEISAADLDSYRISSGGFATSISLAVSASDGYGWSNPTTLTAAAPVNALPTVTTTGLQVGYRSPGGLGALIVASDPEGRAITQYRVEPAGPGTLLWYDGARVFSVPQGGVFVSADALFSYGFSSNGDVDAIAFNVSAYDGYGWSTPERLTVGAVRNSVPVVTSANRTIEGASRVPLATLFSVSDANGDAMTSYRVEAPNGGLLWYRGAVRSESSIVFNAAELPLFEVSGDGYSTAMTVSISAGDGYGSSALTAVQATINNPVPPSSVHAFGPTGPFNAVGSVATVASTVVIPRTQNGLEAFRLDSFVRINPGSEASIAGFQFQALGSNAGWPHGAYLQAGSTILTAYGSTEAPLDLFTANLDQAIYLRGRNYTNDTEAWRVRVLVNSTWSDWTSFSVVTGPGTADYLPPDFAVSVRPIVVGAAPATYVDWVGRGDSDAYRFSVGTSGSLHLDFSNLDDAVRIGLSRDLGGGNFQAVSSSSYSGAASVSLAGGFPGFPVIPGHPSAATLAAGGSATYNLTPGDYQLTLSAPLDPVYMSPLGNTRYRMDVTFQ